MKRAWGLVVLLVVAGLALGCASGHCRGRNMKSDEKVFVSKPDGSVQCSKKPGVSLESMASELKDIEVHSKENKSDGAMHITLCGSPTGKINVFEIKKSDLPKALALGFKEHK